MSAKTASDLAFLRAALEVLEEYLFSSELYWSLGGAETGALPNLTLSNLLLAYVRLEARSLDPATAAELQRQATQLAALYSRWRVAWERKAAVDFHARLVLWRNYIEEYRDQPEAQVDRYAYEVQRRAQLHLLTHPPVGWPAAIAPQAEHDLLKGLDLVLKAVFQPGVFIWEAEVQPGFPHGEYWFLYGRPKAQ